MLLVQPVVLVIINEPSSFKEIRNIFFKCIYNHFEMVFKVPKLYACKWQNKCAHHQNNISLYFPKVSSIFNYANFKSLAKPMRAFFGGIYFSSDMTAKIFFPLKLELSWKTQ